MRTPTTPSSLKWLMNRRARLSGEITKTEKAHQETVAAFKKVEDDYLRAIHALNVDLNATDHLIRQHEVGIDPNLIKPIRSQESSLAIRYGSITRAIYQCFKVGKGKPCNATQVELFIASESRYAQHQHGQLCHPALVRYEYTHLLPTGHVCVPYNAS